MDKREARFRNDFVHRNKDRATRIAVRKAAEAEYAKHQKRIKFRDLANKFVEWRKGKGI